MTKSRFLASLSAIMLVTALLPRAAAQGGPTVTVSGGRTITLSERLVWPHLRAQVRAVGSHLIVKGNERSTLGGSITRGGTSTPIGIVTEVSGNLRYQEQGSDGIKTLATDTNTISAASGSLAFSDTDLVETLLNDSSDHFLVGQMTSAPTRFHGANYRMDNGKNPNYKGPWYDLYEVADQVFEPSGKARRIKQYCLNSQTLLLERVRYKLTRGGGQVRVEVLLTNWKQFQGQQYPTTIARTENGQPIFTVVITTAAAAPAATDGLFSVHP